MADIELVQFVVPAITPIYNNNPGLGVLTLDTHLKVQSFVFNFFLLEDYHRFGGLKTFEEYNPASRFNINLNDVHDVRRF